MMSFAMVYAGAAFAPKNDLIGFFSQISFFESLCICRLHTVHSSAVSCTDETFDLDIKRLNFRQSPHSVSFSDISSVLFLLLF